MGTFSAESSAVDGVQVVRLQGSVDASTSSQLESSLRGQLKEGAKKIAVSMKDVTFMSSAGWGLLLSVIKEIRASGGAIGVAAMSPEIRHVYNLLGMKAFVKEYKTVEEAVAALK